MSVIQFKQPALKLQGFSKRDVRSQFGALCYRIKKDKVQVLLVTSRRRGRWIIPKGWPMPGETPAAAAATEALEEAGVEGKVYNICLGIYSYTKIMDGAANLPCAVSVYPLRVKKILTDYPEQSDRRRKWFTLDKAALKVREPELRKIIKHFDPAYLRGQ